MSHVCRFPTHLQRAFGVQSVEGKGITTCWMGMAMCAASASQEATRSTSCPAMSRPGEQCLQLCGVVYISLSRLPHSATILSHLISKSSDLARSCICLWSAYHVLICRTVVGCCNQVLAQAHAYAVRIEQSQLKGAGNALQGADP